MSTASPMDPSSLDDTKIPVTVLTGFLGSGKTTLVKRLLNEDHGHRLLIIQNEFSEEMGIEAPLMYDRYGNEATVHELPNGCLCCTVKDKLLSTLESVVTMRKGDFDRIIVEANGAADPTQLIKSLWTDEGLNSSIYLDGVVALVDSHYWSSLFFGNVASTTDGEQGPSNSQCNKLLKPDLLRSGETSSHTKFIGPSQALLSDIAAKQIVCADRILLNKADLSSAEILEALKNSIFCLNPSAYIRISILAEVDISFVLNIGAYRNDGDQIAAEFERATLIEESSREKSKCVTCLVDEQAVDRSDDETNYSQEIGHTDCQKCTNCCAISSNEKLGFSKLSSVFVNIDHRGQTEPNKIVVNDEFLYNENEACNEHTTGDIFSLQKIYEFLADVLWKDKSPNMYGSVFRCKALFIAENDCCDLHDSTNQHRWGTYELQGVGQTFEINSAKIPKKSENCQGNNLQHLCSELVANPFAPFWTSPLRQ